MLSIREVVTAISRLNRKGRRDYFKKNRRELITAGISWDMISAQFIGKGVLKNAV